MAMRGAPLFPAARRSSSTSNFSASSAAGSLRGRPRGQPSLSPPQRWSNVLEDRLNEVRVVVDPELIGHGQQEGVGLGDGFVLPELLDKYVGLGRVTLAEDRARAR